MQEHHELDSFPNHPLTRDHVQELGGSNAFVGAIPYPGETNYVIGMLLVTTESFVNVVFDHRNSVWGKLTAYDRETHGMPTVMSKAAEDRASWWAETGRLDELRGIQ